MSPDTYNRLDCEFFHARARDNVRMARMANQSGNHRRAIQALERVADYRETLVSQMRRRAGWTLAERIAGRRS